MDAHSVHSTSVAIVVLALHHSGARCLMPLPPLHCTRPLRSLVCNSPPSPAPPPRPQHTPTAVRTSPSIQPAPRQHSWRSGRALCWRRGCHTHAHVNIFRPKQKITVAVIPGKLILRICSTIMLVLPGATHAFCHFCSGSPREILILPGETSVLLILR